MSYDTYFNKRYNPKDNKFYMISNDIIEEIKQDLKLFNKKFYKYLLSFINEELNKNNILIKEQNRYIIYILKCLILILFDNLTYKKAFNLLNYLINNFKDDKQDYIFLDIIAYYEDNKESLLNKELNTKLNKIKQIKKLI